MHPEKEVPDQTVTSKLTPTRVGNRCSAYSGFKRQVCWERHPTSYILFSSRHKNKISGCSTVWCCCIQYIWGAGRQTNRAGNFNWCHTLWVAHVFACVGFPKQRRKDVLVLYLHISGMHGRQSSTSGIELLHFWPALLGPHLDTQVGNLPWLRAPDDRLESSTTRKGGLATPTYVH